MYIILPPLSSSVDSLHKGNGVVAKAVPYNTQPTTFVEWALSFVTNLPVQSRPPKSPPPVKHKRSSSSPPLATIPEDVDPGSPATRRSSSYHAPLLRVPGVGLVIRIGDLATLPMRATLYYLLSRRIYSPRLAHPM